MIHFICCNCDKEIHGVTIMYDKTHFLHQECELEFKRKKMHDKWEASGFLSGLKGLSRADIVPEYMKCCKSTKIEG